MLVIWIIIGFYTLTKGIRFNLLLLPPLIISAGITVGIIADYIKNLKKRDITKILSLSLIIILFVLAISTAYGRSLTPRVNDDLWNSAKWIKDNTSNDTVIISPWSYRYFFSGIADRNVVFDGRLAYKFL